MMEVADRRREEQPMAFLSFRTPLPLVAAPLAGGPTTPALVTAAVEAGAFGFLAAGYLTADALAEDVATVRRSTGTFGVNLFTPPVVPVDRAAYRSYRERLLADAGELGVDLPAEPVEDDDAWQDKLDLLLTDPVPVVSFTFGVPSPAVVAALRRAGSVLVQTVTCADEARRAADAGVEALVVQASAAGGHSATLTPDRPPPVTRLVDLLADVRRTVNLPLIAAGGVADRHQVSAALSAGAESVAVGTALLLADESGTSAAYRAAFTGPDRGDTVVTRAFTGRPARALRNRFLDAHDADAPLGYPALHHLTRPLRRAAAARTDPERMNLWAGTGYRTVSPRPAGEILRDLG